MARITLHPHFFSWFTIIHPPSSTMADVNYQTPIIAHQVSQDSSSEDGSTTDDNATPHSFAGNGNSRPEYGEGMGNSFDTPSENSAPTQNGTPTGGDPDGGGGGGDGGNDDGEEDSDDSDSNDDGSEHDDMDEFNVSEKLVKASKKNATTIHDLTQREKQKKARKKNNKLKARLYSPELQPLQRKALKQRNKKKEEGPPKWLNPAIIAITEKEKSNDLLFVLMSILGNRRATPFQTEMTPILVVAWAAKVCVYDLILGYNMPNDNIIPLEKFKLAKWKLPRIPPMESHLKTLLQSVHEIIEKKWSSRKRKIEKMNLSGEGVKMVSIPACPTLEEMKSLFAKGRRLIWRIWLSLPNCHKEDCRSEAVLYACENLIDIQKADEFKEALDELWDEAIVSHRAAFLEKERQSKLTDAYDLKVDEDGSNEDGMEEDDEAVTEDGIGRGGGGGYGGGGGEDELEGDKTLSSLVEEDKTPLRSGRGAMWSIWPSSTKKVMAIDTAEEDCGAPTKKLKHDTATPRAPPSDCDYSHTPGMVATKKGKAEVEKMAAKLSLEDTTLGWYLKAFQDVLTEPAELETTKERRKAALAEADRKVAAAVIGINRKSLREIWCHYYGDSEDDLQPPQREKPFSTEYLKPTDQFSSMATDAMHVMKILLEGVAFRGLEVTRYDWEYHLMKRLNCLAEEDPQKRMRAMLACLVLSAASTDFSCIQGTAALNEAGLLDDVDKMAEASEEKIAECIKVCGIHKNRSKFLKGIFSQIKSKHESVVPGSVDALVDMTGVGRKTAILLCNEGHGFFRGIGTDKHVCNISHALGFFTLTFGLKNPAPLHVEASLRTWIPTKKFKETNMIFGSMAQLFTQVLGKIQTGVGEDELSPEDESQVRRLALAISDRIHVAYELEVIWFIIAKIRAHYKFVAKKREKAAAADEEESDDEAVEEEIDNTDDNEFQFGDVSL